jgi:hypothetical protein
MMYLKTDSDFIQRLNMAVVKNAQYALWKMIDYRDQVFNY